MGGLNGKALPTIARRTSAAATPLPVQVVVGVSTPTPPFFVVAVVSVAAAWPFLPKIKKNMIILDILLT